MRTLLIALLSICVPLAFAEEPKPGWIGVQLAGKAVEKGPDCPEGVGVEVRFVWGESPGYRGGLRSGDVILSLDGKPFGGKPKEGLNALKARLKKRPAGTAIRLVVRRVRASFEIATKGGESRAAKGKGEPDPPLDDPRKWLEAQKVGTELTLRGTRIVDRLELTVTLGSRPGTSPDDRVPTNAELIEKGRWPLQGAGEKTDAERLAALMVGLAGSQKDHADLLDRLARIQAGSDGFRLDVVRYLHRAPYRSRTIAERMTRVLGAPHPARTGRIGAFRLLGIDHEFDALKRPAGATATPEQLLDWIEANLALGAAEVERAFAGLSDAERKALPAQLDALVEALGEGIYLFGDTEKNPARRKLTLGAITAARKVDLAALERAVVALRDLTDPKVIARQVGAVAWPPEALAKPILAQKKTKYGLILIGGRGRNVYRKQDAAVLIDLGGDDVYHNNAGASIPGKLPVGIVVDLGGDDAYGSHRRYAQGCGAMGVGILVDVSGDDVYTGTSLTQGCGWFGVGVLRDLAGNDRYNGLSLHQGVGLVGVGMVVDSGGNDRYRAQLYSQGLGLPRGVGMVIDTSGDDEYYAKGERPTGYGTAGVFDAWSQGCGLGFRLDASGGVGMLLDGAGKDRYEAGNFAQGGGYYYGYGLLRDAGDSDDTYIGSRYAQGWTAHQALGAFVEDGGNDRYLTRHGVNAGLAWDQSVTLFLDKGGDDTYQGAFFSMGASAHNSICIFLDLGGRDRYLGAQPGRAGGNTYHGGTSLSLFVDAGGADDEYANPGKGKKARGNGALRAGREHFCFCDLPGSIADALTLGEGMGALRGANDEPPKKDPPKK